MFTFEMVETTDPMTNAVLTTVVRSDGALIPLDPANSDYAEYLRLQDWLAEGKDEADFWNQSEVI